MDKFIETYHQESLFRNVLDTRLKNKNHIFTPMHFSHTRTRLHSDLNSSLTPLTPKNKFKKSNDGILIQGNSESECGIQCKHVKTIKKFEIRLKELIEENQKLNKINEHLMLMIKKKDEMYMNISCENYNMKFSLKSLKNNFKNRNQINSFTKSSIVLKPNNCSTVDLPIHDFDKNYHRNASSCSFLAESQTNNLGGSYKAIETSNSRKETVFAEKGSNTRGSNSFRLSEKAGLITQSMIKKFLPMASLESGIIKLSSKASIKDNTSINQDSKSQKTPPNRSPRKESNSTTVKPTSHYEKIYEMSGRNQKRKYKGEQRMSFLSMNDASLKKMITNELTKELFALTLSDEEFITNIRSVSDDKLIAYCDIVGNMIKDYQNSMKLIMRVKSFLHSSVSLVNSVLQEDSTACLIKNACEILDCERTTLFVHDKITDKLIVHSGKGLKKSELKVPTNRGIVGICFQTGEKIKVDEAYSDVRFNKEVDTATGFKTRNILCVPLKDNDGVIFGAIQSINKKGGSSFNNDDEELMDIFSAQASAILKNSMNYDENSHYISRLKLSIYFSFKVEEIHDMYAFILLAEDHLMSLFSVSTAQFLVYKKNTDSLYHVAKYHVEEKKKVGIVNYIRNKKEFYGCQSVDDCEFYNNLSDLETGLGLITFPVMNLKDENELLAVVQLAYGGKLLYGLKKPKELEMNVIQMFIHMSSSWLYKHQNDPFYTTENKYKK
jgi:hypothetical protein